MLWDLYDFLIVRPLQNLYLNGPEVFGVGFWQGKKTSEICHSVTSYTEVFWKKNTDQCAEIVQQKFQSFFITVQTVIYFFLLYHLLKNSARLTVFLLYRRLIHKPNLELDTPTTKKIMQP